MIIDVEIVVVALMSVVMSVGGYEHANTFKG